MFNMRGNLNIFYYTYIMLNVIGLIY